MSLKKIAEITGLSIATVSHAINGTRAVSEKSKAKVLAAAEEIGYKPSLAAQMLRTQKSNIIALIIPSSNPTNDTNSFYFGVLNGAKAALAKLGYEMIVSTYSDDSPLDLSKLRVLQTRMIDGVLLVPQSRKAKVEDAIEELKIPVVLVDRTLEHSKLPTVQSDNYQAAQDVVRLLAGAGRTNIGFLSGPLQHSTVYERHRGYRDILAELALPYRPELVITEQKDHQRYGYEAMRTLAERQADGVFIENSMLMLGIIAYCQEHHIQVPRDFSLAGFDNAPWMTITTPTITAVQQNANEMGYHAAQMLISLIEGKPVDSLHLLIPIDVMLRQSHNPIA